MSAYVAIVTRNINGDLVSIEFPFHANSDDQAQMKMTAITVDSDMSVSDIVRMEMVGA